MVCTIISCFLRNSVYGTTLWKRQGWTPTNGFHGYMKHVLKLRKRSNEHIVLHAWDMEVRQLEQNRSRIIKANRSATEELMFLND